MNLDPIVSNLSLVGFTLSSILYLLSFQPSRPEDQRSLAIKSAFTTFIFATLAITINLVSLAQSQPVLDISIVSGVLLTAAIGWLTIFGHVVFKMRPIGAFMAPLSALILIIHFFASPSSFTLTKGEIPHALVKAHVGVAILGEAFAIGACGISVLFLWQQRALKMKLLDQLPGNVPAQEKLGRLLMMTLWSGFLCLTLGLLSGALYTRIYVLTPQPRLDLKIIWAAAVWVWYLATLLARNVFNWPRRRIALMSLGGFLLLAVSFFGMVFFRPLVGGGG